MKVLVVFVLLFGVALSRPARSYSDSDSDSSEEVVRRPTSSLRRGTLIPQSRGVIEQIFKAGADSEESAEQEEVAPEETTDGNADANPPSESDSEDSEDDDDTEEEESEEEEDEDDDSSDSSESGESTTDSPVTPSPAPTEVTEEPYAETTVEPIVPTIITDPDQGRGDSLGGYPSDYKSIVYGEDKSYSKIPAPYKSYEYLEEGKKSAYDMSHGNEVEKTMMVYKALQVHPDYLEEDTSTPEVDSQSLDNPVELEPRQASLPVEEEEATANSDSTSSDSGSSSTPEEEEEEEEDSASASQDDEEESESQSNESDESDESDSDEQGAGPDTATDMPVVITAK